MNFLTSALPGTNAIGIFVGSAAYILGEMVGNGAQ